MDERISEAPWNGDASRFTDEQYERACVLDRKSCGGEWASKSPKERCLLPIREPEGDLSRAGVHAAAERIGQVNDVCASVIAGAKSTLRTAYRQLGEDVPDLLNEKSQGLEDLARQLGVTPGVARHGEAGLRWQPGVGAGLRDDHRDGFIGTLHGHFCVFNRWTQINSLFEGRFMERVAPGACKKTFEENRQGMRCLVQHGRDPQVGMKPLGPIDELEEDDKGGRYVVPLFDTSYNRDLLPGLRANQYGASYRFEVIREEVNSDPGRSEHNPDGIEERTVVEMRVREFGPVTFPAYADATAGVRSLNDWMLDIDLELFRGAHPGFFPVRLAELLRELRSQDERSVRPPKESESAPPEKAPETERSSSRLEELFTSTTQSTGAARTPLLTGTEEPPWKL